MDKRTSYARQRAFPDGGLHTEQGVKLTPAAANNTCGGCFCVMDYGYVHASGGCNCIIPPWNLTVVSLGPNSMFESLTIPSDAETRMVSNRPDVNFVCVETAQTLLRQIAGLTFIAQKRSLQARDIFLNMQRNHDQLIESKDEEIRCLREQIAALQLDTQGSQKNCAARNRTMVDKICQQPAYEECPEQVGQILEMFQNAKKPHCKAAEELISGMDTNPSNANLDIQTGFTSDSDVGSDTNDDVDNDGLQNMVGIPTNQIKVAVNYKEDDDIMRKRTHASVSDRPMDIIYGRPKGTRSG